MTLQTLAKKKKTIKKQSVKNAEALISNVKFKKSEAWIKNIQHLKKLSEMCGDADDNTDDLVLTPLHKGGKNPDIGTKKFSRNEASGFKKKQLWCWDDWEMIDHDRSNQDLGMMIKGQVAVLDWDTQEGWDWFNAEYMPDDTASMYNRYTSSEKHSGGHIIFKIDDRTKAIFDKILNQRAWLSKPSDFDSTWDIDLKKEAKTGTPAIVKLPSTLDDCKKQWLTQTTNLLPLPVAFLEYMEQHLYTPVQQRVNKTGRMFALDLLKLIPKNTELESFKAGEWNKIIMECLKQGISQVEFYDWSKDLDISKSYPNHRQHIANQWSWCLNNTETCGRDIKTTLRCVKRVAGVKFDSFIEKAIYNCRTPTFSREFVKLIDWFYDEDCPKKMGAIMRYMNKFFTFTTGMSKNMTYYREYGLDDRPTAVKSFQDQQSFKSATDVKITINAEGDTCPCGDFWRSQATNSYHKVVNRPYGIKEKVYDENLNTFTGYRLKYESNYDTTNTRFNALGNRIDEHFADIICAGDTATINWMRKYFYDMIYLGKRPKVAIFCCSVAMGSGKSMFVNPFAKYIIGDTQSRVIQNFAKMCKDTFSDYYDDATFVILEEIPKYDQAKYSEMYEEFKELITGDTQSSRKFQQAPTQIENHSSWWVNSNHPQGLQPDIVSRRFMCLEVSADKVGDIKYFEALAEAVNNPDAWANWFHRHIIDRFDEFKDSIVEPIEKVIPMTPLKRRIMTRKIDNFTLFFKFLFFETHWYNEDAEDKHEFIRDKKIQVSELFDGYLMWKQQKHIEGDWCDDLLKFTKKIEQHFYMEEQNLTTMTDEDMKKLKKKEKVYLKTGRNSNGRYYIFDANFINIIRDTCLKHSYEVQAKPKYVDKAEIVTMDNIFDNFINTDSDLDC